MAVGCGRDVVAGRVAEDRTREGALRAARFFLRTDGVAPVLRPGPEVAAVPGEPDPGAGARAGPGRGHRHRCGGPGGPSTPSESHRRRPGPERADAQRGG